MTRAITSIFFLIAAVAIYFIWSQPYLTEVKELKTQKGDFEDALANSRQIQTTRDNLLNQYNSISKEDVERLDKIVPSQPDSVKFIMEIDSILKKNGLSLKSIDIRETAESQKVSLGVVERQSYKEIPFTLKATGTYQSFYLFLQDLGQSLRLIDISSVIFRAGDVNSYEFNVTGSIYYLP